MAVSKKIQRVLIANRGEIAVRIARTVRDMQLTPIAVFSDADRDAPHVRACDLAVHIGENAASESYLVADKILAAAKVTGADAIHPGYGFLSENATFARAVEAAGIAFIGPPAGAIESMGSKTAARAVMLAADVPVVPGSKGAVADADEALKVATGMGFPIMIKASAGGGGKGMRIVRNEQELASGFRAASSEAQNAFGDGTCYLEKAIEKPHHVEIQVLSDASGKAMWIGDRECSMQRRHQKVIEESPAVIVTDETRRKMGEVACRAAEAVDYRGAGTVEFLVDNDQNFYFLEMNTRLQVEHPVTELCSGIDLVHAQILVAQGSPLPFTQEDIHNRGHAIEVRIYAEDPSRSFMPSPGTIGALEFPTGPGIRVDSGVMAGGVVTAFYDPMVAKIVAWGSDREQARRRLLRALDETVITGLTTNLQFLKDLLRQLDFVAATHHTGTIAEHMQSHTPDSGETGLAIAIAAVEQFKADQRRPASKGTQATSTSGWRNLNWRQGVQ